MVFIQFYKVGNSLSKIRPTARYDGNALKVSTKTIAHDKSEIFVLQVI